jgi:Ser/Thr protein kinase RdoA (MazF antagonist)
MMQPEGALGFAETLTHILAENWGLRQLQWQPLPSGHTNTSHILLYGTQARVLRVSWPHKPLVQVEREATTLIHLHSHPAMPAMPRICHTHDGQPYLHTDDGRWLHLFERIDGITGLPAAAYDGVGHALRTLAQLHEALAELPINKSNPVAWLLERYHRVSARPAPPMMQALAVQYANVLQHIGTRLTTAAGCIPGPVQWLHGDYHPGNLLFSGSRVSGIVDFDEVGLGSPTLELAFALFAFSRNISCEDRFEFDPALWMLGLHAYTDARGHLDTAWLLDHRDDFRDLFCIDQILIHLEAAQRELWSLTPGIGFLACWHQVQARC